MQNFTAKFSNIAMLRQNHQVFTILNILDDKSLPQNPIF